MALGIGLRSLRAWLSSAGSVSSFIEDQEQTNSEMRIVPACVPLPQNVPWPGVWPSRMTPLATPPTPICTHPPTVFTGCRRYSAAACKACRVFAQTGQDPLISANGGRALFASIREKYALSSAVRGKRGMLFESDVVLLRAFLRTVPLSSMSFGSISPAAESRRFFLTRWPLLPASTEAPLLVWVGVGASVVCGSGAAWTSGASDSCAIGAAGARTGRPLPFSSEVKR